MCQSVAMSDTTADRWQFAETAKEEIELPAPVTFAVPVLITDCATPLA